MNYWLMKSEPDVFSIEHLMQCKDQTDSWDGIRNYQARNFMRDDMQLGDEILFYHSNCKEPGVVGVMQVVKESYPDHTAQNKNSKYFDVKSTKDNPRWFMVDVKFLRKFNRVVTLKQMRADPVLSDMRLLQKGNRLSILPVAKKHWKHILKLST